MLGTAAVQLDLFKQKVRDAKGEADKGTALDEEYAKFAETLNSQFTILQNNISAARQEHRRGAGAGHQDRRRTGD